MFLNDFITLWTTDTSLGKPISNPIAAIFLIDNLNLLMTSSFDISNIFAS